MIEEKLLSKLTKELSCFQGPLDGYKISMPECLKSFIITLDGVDFYYIKQTFTKRDSLVFQRWAGFERDPDPEYCISSF